jgi:SAM-dependent methyltransferase
MNALTSLDVVWHDLECGSYGADLPLWRSLAAEHGGPLLDIGAGTGRVALDLARRGHTVTALDNDESLLGALTSRRQGLDVETVLADARRFELGRRFPLCLMPMQTIQVLGGSDARSSFLACARRHLAPGGLLAIAIADRLDTYEVVDGEPGPVPDVRELDGVVYASLPLAVREQADGFVLDRRREVVRTAGERSVEMVRVHLDRLEPVQLEREAEALGFKPEARAHVPASADYAASEVVMLRG